MKKDENRRRCLRLRMLEHVQRDARLPWLVVWMIHSHGSGAMRLHDARKGTKEEKEEEERKKRRTIIKKVEVGDSFGLVGLHLAHVLLRRRMRLESLRAYASDLEAIWRRRLLQWSIGYAWLNSRNRKIKEWGSVYTRGCEVGKLWSAWSRRCAVLILINNA